MLPIPNPSWVTKALADAYETMEDRVPPKWLPKLTETGARRGRMTATLKEYGCGVYGCVLPTLDPQVVVKVTTDETEVQFATEIASTLSVRVTVDYHLAMKLAALREGRQVYVLWRESAEDVGKLEGNDPHRCPARGRRGRVRRDVQDRIDHARGDQALAADRRGDGRRSGAHVSRARHAACVRRRWSVLRGYPWRKHRKMSARRKA